MNVGGQAVIEGVMMRNKERFAVAVRLPNGKIKVLKEKNSVLPKVFEFPILRGAIGLFYLLYDGLRSLLWSSNQNSGVEEKLSKAQMIAMLALSITFSLLFFVAIPFLCAHLLGAQGVMFNVLDGLFRIIIVIGYLLIISRMQDVYTLFQYHGAEHKTIACYEANKPLTVENARIYSRFHPRCGTSFIFIVLVLSIIVFSFVTGAWWVKLLGRLALMPLIAGLGYELIKLSGKFEKNVIVKIIIAPGLWLQKITTKEPTDKQLEVGIRSLKAVLR